MTQRKLKVRPKILIDHPFLTGLICLVLVIPFVFRWESSHRMDPVRLYLDLSMKQTSILIAFLLTFFALPGIDHLINLINALFSIPNSPENHVRKPLYIVFFIGITAFLVMLLNSRSSILYPINDWVDPNTMFTVGKGVLKGYVPYADLYEQKGPLLIFIHTLGALISYDSFLGIWIIELLFCFAALFLIYKIFTLFFGNEIYLMIPLVAALLYGSSIFSPGDSAEEFCLPLIASALYSGIKAVRTGSFPNKKDFFFLGVTFGCVFWIKYSAAGFYFGWLFYFFIYALRRKNLYGFYKGICVFISGIICVSIPILCYFIFNSALDRLFEAYFYNNIFLYADRQTALAVKIHDGFLYYVSCAPLQAFFILIGVIWLMIRKNWKLLLFHLTSFFASVLFIYMGGMVHGYSGIPLSLFSIFYFLCIWDAINKISAANSEIKQYGRSFSVPILLSGAILVSAFSTNMRYLDYRKEDWFQYKMLDVIDRYGVKNPNILYYNMGDAGINTVAGTIPDLRFFCYYHNPNLKAMEIEQRDCIKNQCADFIIAYAKNERFYPRFETYDHAGYFMGVKREGYPYYHYYVPHQSVSSVPQR